MSPRQIFYLFNLWSSYRAIINKISRGALQFVKNKTCAVVAFEYKSRVKFWLEFRDFQIETVFPFHLGWKWPMELKMKIIMPDNNRFGKHISFGLIFKRHFNSQTRYELRLENLSELFDLKWGFPIFKLFLGTVNTILNWSYILNLLFNKRFWLKIIQISESST